MKRKVAQAVEEGVREEREAELEVLQVVRPPRERQVQHLPVLFLAEPPQEEPGVLRPEVR